MSGKLTVCILNDEKQKTGNDKSIDVPRPLTFGSFYFKRLMQNA